MKIFCGENYVEKVVRHSNLSQPTHQPQPIFTEVYITSIYIETC